MCNTATKEEDKVLCSRCNVVANPNDSWEHDWPNYGTINLGASSVIHWSLHRRVTPKGPHDEEFQKHKIVKAVTEGKHPAVQTFGYQDISIQWAGYDRYPIGMNTRYRLCYECQHELLEIIGEFFFKNIPSEQPIKT